METQSPRVTYFKDDTFCLEVEKFDDNLFLHCQVMDWKLSSLRKGYAVFSQLLDDLRAVNVERVVTVTPNPKFAKLFGGTTVNYTDVEGIKNEIIVWDLM